MDWRVIQRELALRGFDPGPIDGIPGRNTIAALKAFQRKARIAVDGVYGPQTAKALFGETHRAKAPVGLPWMELLARKMGLHEALHTRKLSDFLRSDGKTLGDPSKLPWCGDLAETVIALTLPNEVIPGNPYLARNWAKFGGKTRPMYGAIGVFWRGKRDGISGHVGFLIGRRASDGALRVRGGNQSNSISDTWLADDRLLEARWPRNFIAPTEPLPRLDGSGALSVNEV